MKKYVLVVILWLSFVGGKAMAKNAWSRGELSLADGQVLSGDLSYNWKAEIVQFREGNTIRAFSAFQVREFKYFDVQSNTLRKFITVDYPLNPTFNRTLFLEEFGIGPLMIYRRLRPTYDPLKVGNPGTSGVDEQTIKRLDNFTYYIFEGARITNLDDFSLSLWPRMKDEFPEELTHYLGTLQMDRGSTFARLLIISQYNQLKSRANYLSSSGSSSDAVGLY